MSFIAQKNCVSALTTFKFHPSNTAQITDTSIHIKDLMLFNLFAALHDAGILKPVKTGQTMFL